jgi:hypothetical protein
MLDGGSDEYFVCDECTRVGQWETPLVARQDSHKQLSNVQVVKRQLNSKNIHFQKVGERMKLWVFWSARFLYSVSGNVVPN